MVACAHTFLCVSSLSVWRGGQVYDRNALLEQGRGVKELLFLGPDDWNLLFGVYHVVLSLLPPAEVRIEL